MKKAIIVILSLLSIIACCFGVAACAAAPKIQLPAPENLQIDGRILTWDEVENAEGYIVSIDGEQTAVEENRFVLLTLTGPRTYCIEVAARGEGEYTNSEYSVTKITTQAPVEQGYDEDGFKFTLLEDGTGYEVHRGKAELDGEVYLPDFFDGYPVKRIAYSAFSLWERGVWSAPDPYTGANCNIASTSFRLPAYLEEIGNCAFSGCIKVEEIVIPDSVTSLGNAAFESCIGLKRVTLPKGLKEIGGLCFEACSLEELILPEGLEKIEENAFRSIESPGMDGKKHKTDPSFTSVVIPDSVTEIGMGAFAGCTHLADITLSKNLQYMGHVVFHETAWFENQSEGWVTIRGDILYGYKGESHIAEGAVLEIPSHIKYIAEIFSGYALEDELLDKQNLAGVIIPDGVKIIGGSVFAGCESLTNVKLPADLEVIPDYTFHMCTSLRQIDIPDSVKEIGERAFARTALESVVIPSSITFIGKGAFSACSNLKQIEIPDGVTEIGDSTFYESALESIVLPSSITSIGDYAFGYSYFNSEHLNEVFYKGTAEQWANIEIGENEALDAVTIYYYSENQPTPKGNYWFYEDDGTISIW